MANDHKDEGIYRLEKFENHCFRLSADAFLISCCREQVQYIHFWTWQKAGCIRIGRKVHNTSGDTHVLTSLVDITTAQRF